MNNNNIINLNSGIEESLSMLSSNQNIGLSLKENIKKEKRANLPLIKI